MRTEAKPYTADQLMAAFVIDAPIPIHALFATYGCRTTFKSWQKAGLEVKTTPGMGPTVIPSEFKAFLIKIRGEYAPIKPTRIPSWVKKGGGK